MVRHPPTSTPFPSTTLFRSTAHVAYDPFPRPQVLGEPVPAPTVVVPTSAADVPVEVFASLEANDVLFVDTTHTVDRKSTRLNSSHPYMSYAAFCLKRKKKGW